MSSNLSLSNLPNNSIFFKVSFFGIILLFAIVFSLTSIYPHALFRTHALDLGMFNHALYSYAHLKANHFTLDVTGAEIPYLGDHFSPITMLYAPFYYLFGTYTLLVIQLISILAGGIGVFHYAKYKGIIRWTSLLIMAHFLILWGIFSALSFDFHNNVVAAMLVPWFVLAFDKGNLKLTLLLFALIIMCKENMALWMAFIIIGLLLRNNKPTTVFANKYALILALIAIVWFIAAVKIFMPAYSQGMGIDQMSRYQVVGNSMGEIIKGFFTRPGYYFALIFEDILKIGGTGIKSKFWFLFLVSGGFATIARPQYLIMAIPVIIQKMFSDNIYMWGPYLQYSIEFVPLISFALISLLPLLKKTTYKHALLIILIFTSYYFNTDEQGKRVTKVFNKEFYKPDLDIKRLKQNLKIIPENATISVSSDLAPHLAFRDKLYHFPVVKDATYVTVLKTRNPWPLKFEDLDKEINNLKSNPSTEILIENPELIILKVNPESYHNSSHKKLNEPDTQSSIKAIENEIRSSAEWMEEITKKAAKNKISVDSMLTIDAVWVYNERRK